MTGHNQQTGGRKDKDDKGPEVEVENLKTNDTKKFHMPWTATVADVWAKAYDELGEARSEGDQFQCTDGTSLSHRLSATLEQLREEKLCLGRKFQIRGPTGGALRTRAMTA